VVLGSLVVAGGMITAVYFITTAVQNNTHDNNNVTRTTPLTTRKTTTSSVTFRKTTTTPLTTISTTSVTTTTNPVFSFYAVLITGSGVSPSYTAELYVPSTNISCSLPKLPEDRNKHTLESSGLLCSGYDTSDTCLKWSPDTGSWEKLPTLDVRRYDHVSWTPGPDIGTYLMGGYDSEVRTTTLIKPDGTQEPGFPLQYDTKSACSIPDGDRVIITGGYSTRNTVSVYTVEGWQQDLPPLNTRRYSHACSSYWSDDRMILMVTGGYQSGYIDNTEVYDSYLGSWVTSEARLPRPMAHLRATNIDGRVLIFGGADGNYHDDILEFKPDEEAMVPLGSMIQPRAGHAISVVQTQDYSNWCQ